MKTDGLTKTVMAALRLRVQTAHPCTIAAPAPKPPLFFTRSVILLQQRQRQPPTYLPRFAVPATPATMTSQSSSSDLDSIVKQKRVVRSKVRKDLKAMDPNVRSQEDDLIQSIILAAPWFKSCKRLCAYISCSALREVDTSRILSEVLQISGKDLQTEKKLYVPRVEDKNSHMRMLNISSVDDLIANSMNILEPAPQAADGNELEDVILADDPVDLFLLPGLAFDKSGRRLGRGGGYYDTFLNKYRKLAEEQGWRQPLLVALSYSLQIVDEGVIPVTANDVPVDALVTSSGLIPISSAVFERFQ